MEPNDEMQKKLDSIRLEKGNVHDEHTIQLSGKETSDEEIGGDAERDKEKEKEGCKT